ncbi:PIG-L family deacetylase [Candidatus Dojkabacteria bacterium]|uniref:1D-myo-inositol 2-acetamido-2-deoxy-alpha-D-glucopyranoside deacetylase n=2 Tax=Candidatus Dojkabacteria TaxID=74243 RepID=A0A136KHG1_9BACT|nr:MAG: 1D-myo-inositol 2-acetamido-2-deoxy-alpha-D-glucopyranoside deacetylase [candidate division WS6 bacterium OLB21]MBW7953704.1 PIG-L family deacetylase [Candidatus Dojkabacteria bacterium]
MKTQYLPDFKFPKTVKSILVFVAHPDDESAFTSGLINKAIREKLDVRVIVMSKGENSTNRYRLDPNMDLASTREYELINALQKLGVSNYSIENLPDGGLSNYTEEMLKIIDFERNQKATQLFVTLEPSGIYGHPDHIALTQTVTQYTDIYNLPLIFATIKQQIMPAQDMLSMGIDPELISPLEPSHKISLNLEARIRKYLALRAHRSQFEHSLKWTYDWYKKGLFSEEYYTLNYDYEI